MFWLFVGAVVLAIFMVVMHQHTGGLEIWKFAFAATGILAVVSLLLVVLPGGHGRSDQASSAIQPVATSIAHTQGRQSNGVCASTWLMKLQTPGNGRWVAQGVPSIGLATNPQQARAAAGDWLNAIKANPGTLQGAAAYFLHKDVSVGSLSETNGCATDHAMRLVNELSVALSSSRITPSQAPADGINSGTRAGSVYTEQQAGVTGDRRAIKVIAPNGVVVWIMKRCGNAVTHQAPPAVVRVPSRPTPIPVPSPIVPVPKPHPVPKPTPKPIPKPTPKPTCPGGRPVNSEGLCPKLPPTGSAVPPGAQGGTVTGPASPPPPTLTNPATTTPPTNLPAPGSTTDTTPSAPAPTATNAAPPTAPATGDTNPGPPPM